MTIYSQHPNRGKVQILATYRGPVGVMSSTVTSVDDTSLAARIVDALNRISACATVPVSVHDNRHGRFDYYPAEHLAALTDQRARASLLDGAHSLWYEQVKVLLHQALTDLDDATTAAPAPVRTAITTELETEARELREALAEFSEGIEPPETENRRTWNFEDPFVAFDGGLEGLSSEDRTRLDRFELDFTDEQLNKGVADLRLLLDAYAKCADDEVMLLVDDFTVSVDPFDDDAENHFLNVEAPLPNGAHGRNGWRIDLSRWVPDDPEQEEGHSTGEPVLQCTCSTPPTVTEIVELLNRSARKPQQLLAWAKTPAGEALAGTAFIVTKRFD